ncbi:MAG: ABC transporter permease subunit [Ruegeria sp.]|nr:ABC transporter permease subunit [Ruegeria sp.]
MLKFWNNRQLRSLTLQALALAGVVVLIASAGLNAARNLTSSGVTSGFGFLTERAGYDINFSLIDYSPKTASHAYAWWVGTLNTVFFAVITIVTATFLGLMLAMARLSPNWLLSKTSRVVLEYLRNVPVIVHIFFWYGLFLALPAARQAIPLFDMGFVSNRGVIFPAFDWQYETTGLVVFLGICTGGAVAAWVRLRHVSRLIRLGAALAMVGVVTLIATLIAGVPAHIEFPVKKGFGFEGGMVLSPEFMTLWAAVTVYFSTHCAEVIRGAVMAVPKGQAEAAQALGAPRKLVMLEVVIPQALRAIVPPMASNYINILKAAALGTAIGFLDVMGTTGGSTLNITGQAIECIAIVMLTYMVLNLALSAIMGRINKAVQIKER